MRIIHLANWNSTNIGNGALISGTERSLKEDIPEIELLPEPWDNYTFGIKKFDASFVDFVNSTDGLLIGPAVTLNGQKHQVETGTRVELPLPLWRKIKKPIVFYGISYRHWENQRYHNREQFEKTFAYILNNPKILLSVRNDGTKNWLEKMLGQDLAGKVYVIPDPALYVETRDSFHPELHTEKKNVILSLNNEDEVYRFGGTGRKIAWKLLANFVPEKPLIRAWKKIPGWDQRRTNFLKNLALALETVSKEFDLNIILAPHYFDDFRAISEFIPRCPLRFPHQVLISTGMARVPQTPYFYDLYGKVDLALSMRVHSMSPAMGLGVPTIALTSQSRMTEFLKDAGLDNLGVDIFDDKLHTTLAEKIIAILRDNQKTKNLINKSIRELRNRTHQFNQEILLPFLFGFK